MSQADSTKAVVISERPRYEAPTIQVMTERQILNTFQITQSMAGWWTSGACC